VIAESSIIKHEIESFLRQDLLKKLNAHLPIQALRVTLAP
jgi:hypothetical protein